MIDTKTYMTFKHYTGSTYTDYSHKTNTFNRDTVTIGILTADFVYIGYDKPINAFYFNHTTTYATDGVMTLEYWNGSAWAACTGLFDDTLGLKRSGFVKFDRTQTSQASNSVSSVTKYWYRMSLSVARAALVISGCNIVFSDDFDILGENPYLTMSEFLGTQASHITMHVGARDEIINHFRRKDYYKLDSNGVRQDINAFDLLEIEEVRFASMALTVSKIYDNLSDNKDDVWKAKSTEYRARYQRFIDLAALSVDFNNDGVKDIAENKQGMINTVRMSR